MKNLAKLTKQDLIQAIIQTTQERFPSFKTIEPTTDFKEDLCLDSLDIVDVIMQIEKKYQINFDDQEDIPESLSRLDKLASYTLDVIRVQHNL